VDLWKDGCIGISLTAFTLGSGEMLSWTYYEIAAFVRTWLFRPFLALLGARFAYLFLQLMFKVDPGARLAAAVLDDPSRSSMDVGRWIVLGVPALILVGLYEALRERPVEEIAVASIGGPVTVVRKARPKPPPPVVPDRPIRYAFQFIHPAPFVSFQEKERVGKQVIAKLSSGELRAWGREIVAGKRLSLAEIPRDLWHSSRFTFWFLDEGEANRDICHVECDAPQSGRAPKLYSDLHVNGRQLQAAWSHPASA